MKWSSLLLLVSLAVSADEKAEVLSYIDEHGGTYAQLARICHHKPKKGHPNLV